MVEAELFGKISMGEKRSDSGFYYSTHSGVGIKWKIRSPRAQVVTYWVNFYTYKKPPNTCGRWGSFRSLHSD